MATNLTPAGGLDVGDRVEVTATFLDSAGDPATVLAANLTVTVKPPTDDSYAVEEADYAIADGVVTWSIDLDEPGTWRWKADWDDGTDAAVEEGYAFVRRSGVPVPPAP
jgi:hypothetical protein